MDKTPNLGLNRYSFADKADVRKITEDNDKIDLLGGELDNKLDKELKLISDTSKDALEQAYETGRYFVEDGVPGMPQAGSWILDVIRFDESNASYTARLKSLDGEGDTISVWIAEQQSKDTFSGWRKILERGNSIDLYVSTTGDDKNEGTIESPLKTVTAAIEKADTFINLKQVTIHMREGIYDEEVNVYSCNFFIHILPYEDEKVTIQSQTTQPFQINHVNSMIIRRIAFKGVGLSFVSASSGVIFIDCTFGSSTGERLYFGVHTTDLSKVVFRDCTIENADIGLDARFGTTIHVQDTSITAEYVGIVSTGGDVYGDAIVNAPEKTREQGGKIWVTLK